jgi:hypothetical protein
MMATLETVDGIQITFNPDSVVAVADHDAVTGAIVTCVYGVTKAELRIAEPVDAFLARLGIAAKFAKLTRPNGSPIWINGNSVSSLRAPLPGEYVDGVATVITTGSLTQGVKESPDDTRIQLNAHGGKL